MKKRIILFLLSFLMITISYAETKPAIKDTINKTVLTSDTSLTFATVYKDIKSGISALASALKVGAEHVYSVLVKQQVVYSICYAGTFLICFIFLTWAIKQTPKLSWRDDHYYKSEWEEKGGYDAFKKTQANLMNVIVIIILIGGVCGIGISLSNFDIIVTGFVNPEYGAIKEILQITK